MLPREAWLKIMKGIGKGKVEIFTEGTLNRSRKSIFVEFKENKLVYTSSMKMGGERLIVPLVIDYNEFAKVFPFYFSKNRFADEYRDGLQYEPYLFPIIKKYAFNDNLGDFGDTVEKDEDKNKHKDKSKNDKDKNSRMYR